MDLKTLLPEIEACAREAGRIVLDADADKGVAEKSGRRDLVTRYDREVQRFLEERLLDLLPEAGFLAEEDLGQEAHAEREWLYVVDPIDGTTNFVKGLRQSAVSIALARRGETVLGVICNPYSGELFSALQGGGAFLNGAPVHVSDAPARDALAIVGMSPYYPELTEGTFSMARRLFDGCLDIRRSGSAAIDLCTIAAGRADCYFEARLSPWDYAAGGLLVREAGGAASDLSGGPLSIFHKCSVAASNPYCYDMLLRLAGDCGLR